MWKCQECGRKFTKTKAAERAATEGCPRCGGVDIDLDDGRQIGPVEGRPETNEDRPQRIPPTAA